MNLLIAFGVLHPIANSVFKNAQVLGNFVMEFFDQNPISQVRMY